MDKPIIFLDFDGVVETIYWEKDKDGSWSWNVHKSGGGGSCIEWISQLYF